jgi:hypothetical protein
MKVRMAIAAGVIAVAAMPAASFADEPGPLPRRASPRVFQETAQSYEVVPRLAPDCHETWNAALLRCAPRVRVKADDLATLNALNALPSRVPPPYPQLFAW